MNELSPELLGWIITGIVGIFVLFGIFWGLIRGIKKTAFRGVWLVVTAVIMFILTPIISNGLMNIDLSALNLTMNGGVQITTIKGTVEALISQNAQLAQIVVDKPIVLEIILKLPQIFLNVLIFLLGFWLLKILLWPVWAIIAGSVFKKKKPDGTKLKKNRWAGALLGAVIGLFISVVTFMPLISLADMATSIETETEGLDWGVQNVLSIGTDPQIDSADDNSPYEFSASVIQTQTTSTGGGLLTQVFGPEIVSYLNGYNSSVAANVFKYTGMKEVSKKAFKGLTTVNVNNVSVNLQDEIYNVVNIAKIVNEIEEIDFENITQADLNLIFNNSQELIDYVFNSNLLDAVGNEMFPYFFDEMNNNPNFIVKKPDTGNGHLNHLLSTALDELSTIDTDYIKNELKALARAGSVLNDTGFIYAEIVNPQAINENLDLITDQTIDGMVANIFQMHLVSNLAPVAINTGVYMLADQLHVQDFTLNENISVEQLSANLQNTVSSIFKHSLNLYKSLNFDSQYYVTGATFTEAGALLDTIINYPSFIINENNVVLQLFQNQIADELDSQTEIPTEFLNDLKYVIYNLDDVNSYSQELGNIGDAFNHITDVVDKAMNAQSSEELQFSEEDLYNIGYAIEKVENLRLFGAYSYLTNSGNSLFRKILIDALNYGEEQINKSQLNSVFAGVRDNLGQDIDWTIEIPLYQPIINLALSQPTTQYLIDDDLANYVYYYYTIVLNETTLAQLETIYGNGYDATSYNLTTQTGTVVWTFDFGTENLTISAEIENGVVVAIEKSGVISIIDFGWMLDNLEGSQLFGDQIITMANTAVQYYNYENFNQFTYENYADIDNTYTYEELVNQFGEPDSLVSFDIQNHTGTIAFTSDDSTVTITVTFSNNSVISKSCTGLSPVNEISYQEIIVNDSTYSEVSTLLGTSDITSNSYVSGNGQITWTYETKMITVEFANDVVSSKSQTNLNLGNTDVLIQDIFRQLSQNIEQSNDIYWTEEAYNLYQIIDILPDANEQPSEYNLINNGMTLSQVEALLGINYLQTYEGTNGNTVYVWENDSSLITVEFSSNAVVQKSIDINFYKLAEVLAQIQNSQIITTQLKQKIYNMMLLGFEGDSTIEQLSSTIVQNLANADYDTIHTEIRQLVSNLIVIQSGNIDDYGQALESLENMNLFGFESTRDLFEEVVDSTLTELNDALTQLQQEYADASGNAVLQAQIQQSIDDCQSAITTVNGVKSSLQSAQNGNDTDYPSYITSINNAISVLAD